MESFKEFFYDFVAEWHSADLLIVKYSNRPTGESLVLLEEASHDEALQTMP